MPLTRPSSIASQVSRSAEMRAAAAPLEPGRTRQVFLATEIV